MKLRLNLATAPQENNRPFLAGAMLIGVLVLIACALLSHAAYSSWRSSRDLRADTARWEIQMRRDRQRQQELRDYFHSPSAQQTLDRSLFLNSLIDERSFPWTKVFMDLEQTLPPGVRVVSIAPKFVDGRAEVALQIGAASDAGKIEFLEAMEKSKVFSGLTIKDEKYTETGQAGDRIVLNLSVWYSTT